MAMLEQHSNAQVERWLEMMAGKPLKISGLLWIDSIICTFPMIPMVQNKPCAVPYEVQNTVCSFLYLDAFDDRCILWVSPHQCSWVISKNYPYFGDTVVPYILPCKQRSMMLYVHSCGSKPGALVSTMDVVLPFKHGIWQVLINHTITSLDASTGTYSPKRSKKKQNLAP